jgi:hypothetical protein
MSPLQTEKISLRSKPLVLLVLPLHPLHYTPHTTTPTVHLHTLRLPGRESTRLAVHRERGYWIRGGLLPSVVPAECIEYSSPLFLRSRWTSATSLDTDAVGVPSGMRQKSAVHDGGVASLLRSSEDAMAVLIRLQRMVRIPSRCLCGRHFDFARDGAGVSGPEVAPSHHANAQGTLPCTAISDVIRYMFACYSKVPCFTFLFHRSQTACRSGH